MRADVAATILSVTGSRPVGWEPLAGGCVARVGVVCLADGGRIVVKQAEPGQHLALEAFMLGYLGREGQVPVPAVLHADDRVLVMSYVEPDGEHLSAACQAHAGELVARLHDVTAPAFGFERDTLIGGLVQPNPWRPAGSPSSATRG